MASAETPGVFGSISVIIIVVVEILVGLTIAVPLVCVCLVVAKKKLLKRLKSCCSSCSASGGLKMEEEYRCSEKIDELLHRKRGANNFIIGSTLDEIRYFWQHVGYKADGTIGEPREVSKTIVDIDCKSHGNYAVEGEVEEDGKKPRDWFDQFTITSKKSQDESKSKSYTLQDSTNEGFQIGGNAGLKAGSAFFNVAGGGMIPELGINASYHNDETKTSTRTETHDTKLSQLYEIVEDLHVAPKKKVEAKITTWAVTYEADTTLRYTVDVNVFLPVRYRTHLSRVLGGFFVSTEYFSAREIFEEETNFRVVGDNVVFTREAKVSYVGEQVEIKKRKDDIID